MIPTLRTLTLKSTLGFGKYKDLTVQKILDMKMNLVLISPYFKLTSINYNEEVLSILSITEKYRITKPGTDNNLYYLFLNENGYIMKNKVQASDKLKKPIKELSKQLMQRINQGK